MRARATIEHWNCIASRPISMVEASFDDLKWLAFLGAEKRRQVGVSLKSKRLYGFGSYRLDALERVLLRDGQSVTLPPKDLETLLVLVERSGHIVEKGELLEKVWPGVFVEEGNLARHIFNLRRVLVMARTDANTSKLSRSEAIASLLR